MPGDSDNKNLFDRDGEEGDEEIPTSSQELLGIWQQALKAQQMPPLTGGPAQNEPPELPASNSTGDDAPAALPTAFLPPWPTRPSDEEPDASTSGAAPARRGPPTEPMSTAPPPSLPPSQSVPEPDAPVTDVLTAALPPLPEIRRRRSARSFSTRPAPAGNQRGNAFPRDGAVSGWSSFRRRSPWLVPLLFVLLFFLLMLVLDPSRALGLLFIFAAIGVLEAAVLWYIQNDAFWVVAVVAGFVLMTAVTFFVFFTTIFAVVLSILLLALGVVAIRERYYPVKDGTVAVTGLSGKYNRTLQPGFNLLVPGEKVLGVVETQQVRAKVHIPSLMLFTGERVALDAAMSYEAIPGQEYLAVRNTNNWKRLLQEQLAEVVQDVVSTLSADDFSRQQVRGHPSQSGADDPKADPLDQEHGPSPLAHINDLLTRAMRDQVKDRGVAIHAVKIRLLDGSLIPGGVSSPVKAPAPTPPDVASHPTNILPFASAGKAAQDDAAQPGGGGPPTRPLPHLPGDESVSVQPPAATLPKFVLPGQSLPMPSSLGSPIMPPPRGGAAPVVPEPPKPSVLSPQALAETYDAVLRRRITDIDTIRRIVVQFETVANDPVLSEQAPFDAAAGAQNLINHLYQLELQNRLQASSPSDDGPLPAAPQQPLEPEED